MEYEIRCALTWTGGAYGVTTEGARLARIEPGEEADEIVFVFEAEGADSWVEIHGAGPVIRATPSGISD